MKKRIVILAAGLVMGLAAQAFSTQDLNYSGEYVMKGKGFGPNDSAYKGTCSLERRERIYLVSCYNEDTKHTYKGKGLADGDTLSVFIGDLLQGDHNSSFTGEYLVLYRRQPDGSLAGIWAHAESSATGAETLTRKR